MAKPKLRAMLDNYQGKDRKAERRVKMAKETEQRRLRQKERRKAEGLEEEQPLATESTATKSTAYPESTLQQQIKAILGGGLTQDDMEWSTEDEDEEDEAEVISFDAEQLNESDSDSELGDVDESAKDDAEDAVAIPTVNGAPIAAHPTDLDDKVSNEDEEDEEGNGDDQEEDIPLSELESEAGSGDADIVPYQRLTINNISALERAVKSITLPTKSLSFSEHQSLTTAEPVSIPDVEDDLARELAFYSQSLNAVKQARTLLQKEGLPFTRPTDYFAEMVKSDEHMGKIKSKLIDDAASKKAGQDARRQRDLKRFGKQVQQEKLKERAKDKRDMLDKVKSLKRKRQGEGLTTTNEEDMFDVAADEAAPSEKSNRRDKRDRGGRDGPNSKRQKKDSKYGFGGKKRFAKSGDATSSADMTGFSTRRMKGQKKGATQRPGKTRRAAQR